MRIAAVVLVAVLYAPSLLRATEVRADRRDEPPRSAPGQNQPGVEELKASVVKIVSKAPEGQPRTGTGFIVRVDDDDVYIATAAHVIAGDPQPLVTFHFNKRRPMAAKVGELETDNATAGLGFLIVSDRAVAKQATALGWTTGMLRGGEQILTIGFGLGTEWGVINGTVASVSGSDIRIDGRIDEGNSGGPILMNGSVAGMVTSLRQGLGVAKSAIVVQSTLRGWDIEISEPPTGPGGRGSTTASLRKVRKPGGRLAWERHLHADLPARRRQERRGQLQYSCAPRICRRLRNRRPGPDHDHPHRSRAVQDDSRRIHQG